MSEETAETPFKDGDRVKITMKGVYRQPTPDWKPFVVINDGTTVDATRWAVEMERLTDGDDR